MTHVPRSEQSHRSKEIERRLDTAADLLGDLTVLRALGDNPGRFQNMLPRMYVPNVRGTRLETPKDYQNDTSIPVVMLGTGEKLAIDNHMAAMHRQQVATLSEFALRNEYSARRDLVLSDATAGLAEAHKNDPYIELSHPDTEEPIGRTITNRAEVTIGSLPRIVHSRPVVVLSDVVYEPRLAGINLVHQLAHVDTRLTKPPILATDVYSDARSEEQYALELAETIAQKSLRRKSRQR